MIFRCFGIKVEISYIFVCAVTVFIAADRTGLFIPILLFVAVHELGHIVCLKFFKCRIKSVKFIIGTVGIEYDDSISKIKKAISLFAGPAANLLAFLLCMICRFPEAAAINLIIAAYNLLPIKGLDGGAITEALLSGLLSGRVISYILSIFTFSIVIILLIFYTLCLKSGVGNISVLLFCFYLSVPLFIKKLC